MATSKKNGTDGERVWWPARECWTFLGVTRQKWQRIVAEHPTELEPKTDDRGIQRFNPDAVEEICDRFGFGASADASTIAITTLRETIESQTDYIKTLQSSEREYARMLREENDDLRKMRKEEQAAHLHALEATQEALDHSAERKAMLQAQEGSELRKSLALEWLTTKIGPKLIEQWRSSGAIKKIAAFVRKLSPDNVAALKMAADDPELNEAIDEIRKEDEPQGKDEPQGEQADE